MSLPLKDVHPGLAPPWWPPAPGWWLLAGGLLLLGLAVGGWWWRRRKLAAWMGEFDAALASATTPAEQVAAMSQLLRRAARRVDPAADRLYGADWLEFLDRGLASPVFAQGPGALLADGGYRPEVDPAAVAALRTLVRQRYRSWMRPA